MKQHLACLLLAFCGAVHAAETASDEAVRAQIDQERKVLEARHRQREQACRSQFIVTPCLEKARIEQQESLQALRKQELTLDEAKRRQRSLAQARRLAGKAQAAAARAELAASKPTPSHHTSRAGAFAGPAASAPALNASAPERPVGEARRRVQFEARQREIRQHREAAERRNAARVLHKKPIPLLVPARGDAR